MAVSPRAEAEAAAAGRQRELRVGLALQVRVHRHVAPRTEMASHIVCEVPDCDTLLGSMFFFAA